ncbi:carboxylic ester hydrolase-like [Zophobas morio]|uniref:carboxylic ester hydrolase-like n=1 Tax=Zophobas morio TaxID=2755281 RepID=UPI003082B096
MFRLDVFLTLLLLQVSICVCDDPIVQTPLGTVKGWFKKSVEGRDFAAFEGIPFAKPPIGSRRFEPPEPVEPWLGTWNAVHLFECAQTNLTQADVIIGDEDCLYVNVYVPRDLLSTRKNLDVIVHIHGGGFMYGSGHMYSIPDVLMDQDVVFVTFNYRVGILGFLSTEDEVVPGNNGMKDQVLALKWVQNNIASFGGNPKSVTLTGLSAGGASVHLHFLSSQSKGLFRQGFSQSGVALNSFSLQKEPLTKTKILAKAVGCPFSCTKAMVKCLKQKPYKHLLDTMKLFFGFGTLPVAPFGPAVEKGPDAFLPKHPYEILASGAVIDVPVIFTSCAHEGYIPMLFSGDAFDTFDKDWETLAPIILDFNYTLDHSLWASTAKKIRQYYFGEKKMDKEAIMEFTKMIGDRMFLVDSEKSVKLQAKAATSPVYYGYLSYPGDDENMKFVPHGADARYYFGPVFDPRPLTEKDLKVRKVLVGMLISYAKTGVPKIDGVEWEPVEGDKLTYLDITGPRKDDIILKTVDELTPVKFWTSLNLAENENLMHIKDEL